MTDNVRWTVSADMSKAIGDLKKMTDAQDKFLQRMEKQQRLTKEQIATNRAARQAEAEKDAIQRKYTSAFDRHMRSVDKARTPLQKYNDAMRELSLIEGHGIGRSQESAAAREHALKTMQREEQVLRENTEEFRRNARVQAEARKAFLNGRTSIQKYRDSLRELRTAYRETGMSQADFLARRKELREEFVKGNSSDGRLE